MFRMPAPRQSTDSAFLQMQSSGHTNSGAAVTSALDAGVASVASASAVHSSNSVNKLVHIFVQLCCSTAANFPLFHKKVSAETPVVQWTGHHCKKVQKHLISIFMNSSVKYSNERRVSDVTAHLRPYLSFFPFKFGTTKNETRRRKRLKYAKHATHLIDYAH
jgi:hypothetical protein